MLTTSGLTRCLMLAFDENSGLPVYQSVCISWPSPDGKTVDGFVRNPQPVDSPQTYFNLGHYWYRTTREDHTATVALVHKGKPPAVWYGDLICLSSLAPVLGQWTTFSRFFSQATGGEHIPSLTPDDFHFDYLSERTAPGVLREPMNGPVSSFARHIRLRRRLDTCWTLAALHRGLAGAKDTLEIAEPLQRVENAIEDNAPDTPTRRRRAGGTGEEDRRHPGRSAAEPGDGHAAGLPGPQPVRLRPAACPGAGRSGPAADMRNAGSGPVKACQVDGNLLRVVVEVPALGFAWIPREGPPGTTATPGKIRLADAQSLTMRNEFYEVDIDSADRRAQGHPRPQDPRQSPRATARFFNPGSQMKMTAGQGHLHRPGPGRDHHRGRAARRATQELAKFRQRFRLWLGRPVLEMRIELEPVKGPTGYPWFAYYGSRFAWRDERSFVLRSSAGTGYVTSHPRAADPRLSGAAFGPDGHGHLSRRAAVPSAA